MNARKAVFQLHLWTALIVGLFIVVSGVTGSIMVFEGELDRLFNPALYRVQPAGQRMTVSEMLAAANRAYPDERIGTFRLPVEAADSAVFTVRPGMQVFLNPYTGGIVGTRRATTVLALIHQMHLHLLLGPVGEQLVAAATAALIFLVLSGVYLWWPLKRASITGAGWWNVTFDLHNTVGIYAALFLLTLAITGLVAHYDDEIETWLHEVAGTTKIAKDTNAPSIEQPGAVRISADRAIQAAVDAMPGTTPFFLFMPPDRKSSYLVLLRYPEDTTPGGRSWANVDQFNGTIVNAQSSRTVGMGTKPILINRAIHTGDLFGYPSKVVASLSALMIVVQAFTGYFMWWRKLR